jgi:hypothetical protein
MTILLGALLAAPRISAANMSLFTSAMWAQMSTQVPNAKMPPGINPQSVKLTQGHPEILQKWEQSWPHHARERKQQ